MEHHKKALKNPLNTIATGVALLCFAALFSLLTNCSSSAPKTEATGQLPTTTPPPAIVDETPSYVLSASAQVVNEGSPIAFTLATRNVPDGTRIPFTLSGTGIEGHDFLFVLDFNFGTRERPRPLKDDFEINNNKGKIEHILLQDRLVEGRETLRLSLDNVANVAMDVHIEDTTPSYAITVDKTDVAEGSQITFQLATSLIAAGETLKYRLYGRNSQFISTDVSSGGTVGSFTIDANGMATKTLNIADDGVTEGTESFQMILDDTRPQASSPLVRIPSQIATERTFSDPAMGVSFTGDTASTGAVVANPNSYQNIYTIDKITVNQIIERTAGSTPFFDVIPAKPGLIRVYFGPSRTLLNQPMTIRLSGAGSISSVAPITIAAAQLRSTGYDTNQGASSHAYTFDLRSVAEDWFKEGAIYRVESYFGTTRDTSHASYRTATETFTVQEELPPLRIQLVTSTGTPRDLTNAEMEDARQRLNSYLSAIYPFRVNILSRILKWQQPTANVDVTTLRSLATLRSLTEDDPLSWSIEPVCSDVFYVLLVNDPAPSRRGRRIGVGFVGNVATTSFRCTGLLNVNFWIPYTDRYLRTVAHEIGHNYGFGHVDSGNSERGTDPNFPDALGRVQIAGYSANTHSISSPDARDYMSYHRASSWISGYHYNNVIRNQTTLHSNKSFTDYLIGRSEPQRRRFGFAAPTSPTRDAAPTPRTSRTRDAAPTELPREFPKLQEFMEIQGIQKANGTWELVSLRPVIKRASTAQTRANTPTFLSVIRSNGEKQEAPIIIQDISHTRDNFFTALVEQPMVGNPIYFIEIRTQQGTLLHTKNLKKLHQSARNIAKEKMLRKIGGSNRWLLKATNKGTRYTYLKTQLTTKFIANDIDTKNMKFEAQSGNLLIVFYSDLGEKLTLPIR